MNAPMIMPDTRPLTVRACAEAVAAYYEVSKAEMISPRQVAEVVRPRQVAIYLAQRHSKANLTEIGRFFGGRHSKTVRHSLSVIAHLMTAEPGFAEEVMYIEATLQAVRRSAVQLPGEYPDPLKVAVACLDGRRANPTTEELRCLAAYVVQRAVAVGELVFEGVSPSSEDPDMAPVDRPFVPGDLKTALQDVLTARAAHKAADALARANTRVRLEIALDGLQLAFEAVSKEI